MSGIDLARFPIHLGQGATDLREQEFTGDPQWYAACAERQASDGADGGSSACAPSMNRGRPGKCIRLAANSSCV